MSTYTAKDYFADWYKEADKNSDVAIHPKRINAINGLIKNDVKEFWFDIIRCALSRPIVSQANLDKFINEFKTKDPGFPLINNDNLVKVLAAITICFKIEKINSVANNHIAYALNNLRFFNPLKKISIPLFESATKYKERNSERADIDAVVDLSALQDLQEKLAETETVWDKNDIDPVIDIITYTADSLSLLQEESNILWWIFGEYSGTSGKGFKETGAANISLTAAKDLSQLTKFTFDFPSARSILSRVINIAGSAKHTLKESTIEEIITAIDKDYIVALVKPVENKISDITPILLILQKSLNYASTDSWGDPVQQQIKLETSKKISLIDFCYQLYNELLLMKNL